MQLVPKSMRSPRAWHSSARWLYERRVPVIPGLIDYLVRWCFACWLPHTASVGPNLELGYGGLGCVIHGDCVLGSNVHIGPNVVLGGNAREQGAPVIEDDVYIGAGAMVLGPVTIGCGSVVAAGAIVTRDVAPRTVVAGNPARVIKEGIDIQSYLYHLRGKAHDGGLAP